jgi:hypothetical protein
MRTTTIDLWDLRTMATAWRKIQLAEPSIQEGSLLQIRESSLVDDIVIVGQSV